MLGSFLLAIVLAFVRSLRKEDIALSKALETAFFILETPEASPEFTRDRPYVA